MERLNPLNDYLFLKIMGEEGDEEQCIAFINAILADSAASPDKSPLRLVKILENRSLSSENLGDKAVVLDFRALAETDNEKNIKVNIEVQLKDLQNMTERTLYYWAREYISGIKEGEDYSELPRVITINVVDFDHVKLENFHTAFRLREDTHHEYILTDVIEVHFLNMVKFRKFENKDVNNALCRWLTYLDVKTPENKLEEVIKMDVAIQKAQTRLEQVTRDNEFMHEYTMRVMGLSDLTSLHNTAFNRGIERGREEGSINIAKKALSKGYSIDTIQELTGLKVEDITALQTK